MDNNNTNKPIGSGSTAAAAVDGFFVKPPAINQPKGAGAIHAVNEKFQVNPFNGSAGQTIPLFTSLGRVFAPQPAVNYDSGSGNDMFGFGWSLALPSITRKTSKGLPRYHDSPGSPAKDSDVFFLSGAEDFVPDERGAPSEDPNYHIDAFYRGIEGLFARIERWRRTDNGIIHWRSFSPDNVLTIYGGNPKAPITDPHDLTKIFEWLITETFGNKGSAIAYHYKPGDEVGVDTSKASESHRFSLSTPVNTYLEKVQYCNAKLIGRQQALQQINGGVPKKQSQAVGPPTKSKWHENGSTTSPNHPNLSQPTSKRSNDGWRVRPDPFSTYNAGFEQRTYRLYKRILMFHHFPESTDSNGNHIRRMDRIIPWKELCQVIEPWYPAPKGPGRRPVGIERVLRIHFLQHCFGLSDPAAEEALYDSRAMRRFVGIDLGVEPAPDESTILNFRHLLEQHDLGEQLFHLIDAYLQENGLEIAKGTIVDATIIKAPSSTKNQQKARDPEMKSTRKGQQWYFGMKLHIGVDSRTKLIHSLIPPRLMSMTVNAWATCFMAMRPESMAIRLIRDKRKRYPAMHPTPRTLPTKRDRPTIH